MMDNSAPPRGTMLDRTAVALSGICLLHCLALPFLVVLLPLATELPATHWHAELLVIVLPVSIVAFAMGYRRHGSLRIMAAGTFGLLLLVLGGTIVHAHYGVAEDRALTVAGSLILAVAHFYNARLGRHLRPRGGPAREGLRASSGKGGTGS